MKPQALGKPPPTGFTLLEVVIYLALFSIILSGAIVTTVTIIDTTRRLDEKIMVQEEANFLLRKIAWVLSGLELITAPAAGAESNFPGLSTASFCVNKINFSGNPVEIYVSDSKMFLRTGGCGSGGTIWQLNTDNLGIASSTFEHFAGPGSSKPEGLRAAFTFTNSTQYFEITKYLRK